MTALEAREPRQPDVEGEPFDLARSDHVQKHQNLFNFEPPATEAEVRAASIQFVRKISGFAKPAKANEEAFELAIQRVSAAAGDLLESLVTNAGSRDRAVEATKAQARAAKRFGTAGAQAEG